MRKASSNSKTPLSRTSLPTNRMVSGSEGESARCGLGVGELMLIGGKYGFATNSNLTSGQWRRHFWTSSVESNSTAETRLASQCDTTVNRPCPRRPSLSHSLPWKCSTTGGFPGEMLAARGTSLSNAVQLCELAT